MMTEGFSVSKMWQISAKETGKPGNSGTGILHSWVKCGGDRLVEKTKDVETT